MKSQLKTTEIRASGNTPPNQPKFERTETFTELTTTKMTAIVSTPYRLVDLLETAEGMFVLREVTLSFDRGASMSRIWLKPHELTALEDAIRRLRVLEGGKANV